MVSPLGIPFLRTVQEPELAGHRPRVEEVAAYVDHHVDGPVLHQLAAHLRFVASRAGCLGRHDDAGPTVLVQIAVEVREPEVVGVGDLLLLVDPGKPERQARIPPDLLCVHLVHVEGRIGHHEVALFGELVRVLVVRDGIVARADRPLQGMRGKVDLGAVVSFFSWP